MKIELNGATKELQEATSVEVVIESVVGLSEPKGVAVALNGTVVRKQLWATTVLSEGDKLEIVRAMAGG